MTSFSRQDVLRILQISSRQLQGWERAGLIPFQQAYTVPEMGQLRTLRSLRASAVPAASIRHSITAMKAVAGMANPLLEATLVHTGSTRIAFRHHGAMVDPIRRQLLFDFERAGQKEAMGEPEPMRNTGESQRRLQDLFLSAVQAEEKGEKERAIGIYSEIVAADPSYAAAYINLGTLYFHQRQFGRAEELYRRASEEDPEYVLAFFDLGNVLDELNRMEESIAAYRQAVALSPGYADAHYNLALALERKGDLRQALRHWHAYLRLDRNGPWADHARTQIRKILSREKLAITWRRPGYLPPSASRPALRIAPDAGEAWDQDQPA